MSRMPQQARSQKRRDALLRAAVDLIAEGGVRAISHRAVAARAGLPASTTGYFYASIDDLTAEALRMHAARTVADYLDLTGIGPDLQRSLRAVCEVSVDSQVERAQIEIYLEGGRNPTLAEPVGQVLDGFRRTTEQLLETIGMPAAKRASSAVVALFDGFTLQRLARPDAPPDTEELIDALTALLVGYLADDRERAAILDRLTPQDPDRQH